MTLENVPTVTIAVMGATGSGKSTFINLASGSNLMIGNGLRSCTNAVNLSFPFELGGSMVTLIDTPGFDDTIMSDIDVLNIIGGYMATSFAGGQTIQGVIYVHRISDIRVGGTAMKNFRMFQKMCGPEYVKNIKIVTNMWGEVTSDVGEERERQLQTDSLLFKSVLDQGAQLLRHLGTRDSAHEILLDIIKNNTPKVLHIQKELVIQGIDITETEACKELDRELAEVKRRNEVELKELEEQMAEAIKRHDLEEKEELEQVLRELKEAAMLREKRREDLSATFAGGKFGQRIAQLPASDLGMESDEDWGATDAKHGSRKTFVGPSIHGKMSGRAAFESEGRVGERTRCKVEPVYEIPFPSTRFLPPRALNIPRELTEYLQAGHTQTFQSTTDIHLRQPRQPGLEDGIVHTSSQYFRLIPRPHAPTGPLFGSFELPIQGNPNEQVDVYARSTSADRQILQQYSFLPGPVPPCSQSSDANVDGRNGRGPSQIARERRDSRTSPDPIRDETYRSVSIHLGICGRLVRDCLDRMKRRHQTDFDPTEEGVSKNMQGYTTMSGVHQETDALPLPNAGTKMGHGEYGQPSDGTHHVRDDVREGTTRIDQLLQELLVELNTLELQNKAEYNRIIKRFKLKGTIRSLRDQFMRAARKSLAGKRATGAFRLRRQSHGQAVGEVHTVYAPSPMTFVAPLSVRLSPQFLVPQDNFNTNSM